MGVKPMEHDADVLDRGGDVLVSVKASVWQIGQTSGAGGETALYAGLCSSEGAAFLVGKQNRVLQVESINYNVVEATHHKTLDYVELSLRITSGSG
jgi:hypothetical protein